VVKAILLLLAFATSGLPAAPQDSGPPGSTRPAVVDAREAARAAAAAPGAAPDAAPVASPAAPGLAVGEAQADEKNPQDLQRRALARLGLLLALLAVIVMGLGMIATIILWGRYTLRMMRGEPRRSRIDADDWARAPVVAGQAVDDGGAAKAGPSGEASGDER
jgi:hypothetical protein